MRLVNFDKDSVAIMSTINNGTKQNTLKLGKKISSEIPNEVIMCSEVFTTDLSKQHFKIKGVNTPFIVSSRVEQDVDIEIIGCEGSSIFFTGMYSKDASTIIGKVFIDGNRSDLKGIEIIAGGILPFEDGSNYYNLVLKVPNTCNYLTEDGFRFDMEDTIVMYDESTEVIGLYNLEDVVNNCKVITNYTKNKQGVLYDDCK